MTTFTKAQLATRVLRDLGLYGSEETPSAVDQADAEETVGSEILLLAAKDIPIWNGSATSIPEQYLTALSRRLGLAIGPGFGLFTLVEAEQAMPLAENNLRILAQTGPTYETQTAEYF